MASILIPPTVTPTIAAPGGAAVRCVPSGPDRSDRQYAQHAAGRAGGGPAACPHPVPYFLPDQTLIGALADGGLGAGAWVDIVIPGKNNLRLVDCAMTSTTGPGHPLGLQGRGARPACSIIPS